MKTTLFQRVVYLVRRAVVLYAEICAEWMVIGWKTTTRQTRLPNPGKFTLSKVKVLPLWCWYHQWSPMIQIYFDNSKFSVRKIFMFYKYVKILNFILNLNSCIEFREKICNINFSIKIQNLKIETKYLLINNDYNRVKSISQWKVQFDC